MSYWCILKADCYYKAESTELGSRAESFVEVNSLDLFVTVDNAPCVE